MYKTHTITNVHFDEQSYTLLLPVLQKIITPSLLHFEKEADRNDLHKKDEFHITVLGFGIGKIIKTTLEKNTPQQQLDIIFDIKKTLSSIDWTFSVDAQSAFYFEKNYRDVKTKKIIETRKSIVQMVFMPSISKFITEINTILNLHLDAPPAHVTLYTTSTNPENTDAGIGLNKTKDLESLHPRVLKLIKPS